jgi:hypothetical protein
MRVFFACLLAFTACVALACSGESEPPPSGGSGGTAGAGDRLTGAVGESVCGAELNHFEIEGASHVTNCSPVEYGSNPPSSGTHYGTWAAFRNYDNAVPRGFWVHSMEHGAVVIAYSCTDCEDEVAEAKRVIAEAGPDPRCCSESGCDFPVSRVILTPDPLLETPWAAASWGYTLTADCFEPEVFAAFIDERRGQGAEAVCADGADLSDPPC